MIRCIILLLFLPVLTMGQAHRSIKKKKPVRPRVETIAPPAAPSIEAPGTPDITGRDTLPRPASLMEAFRISRERQLGLLLFAPFNITGSKTVYRSTGFLDSLDVVNYVDELSKQGSDAYRDRFVVYQWQAGEKPGMDEPLLYPAYIFFDPSGQLIGRKEGIREDVYSVISEAGILLQQAQEKGLLRLRDKYLANQASKNETFLLIRLIRDWNSNHYDKPITPDAYTLTADLLRKQGQGTEQDTSLLGLVKSVWLDNGYVKELSDPLLLDYLLLHYQQLNDNRFVWYDAISGAIDNAYAKLTTGDALPAPGDGRLMADSLRQRQARFVTKLRNVQLLIQGNSLLQKYHDYLKEAAGAEWSVTQTFSKARWLFDSILQAENGMASVQQFLQKVNRGMSAEEQEFVVDRYVDFPAFSKTFSTELALLLNNISWELFKADLSNNMLPHLLSWSKASLEAEPNNPFYLDTYAHIAYAKGDKAGAILRQQKAIELMQKTSTYADARWMIPQMKQVLANMKAGDKAPREEYVQAQR
jgi:hypothetical protein